MLHFIFFLESYILQFIFEFFYQIYFIKIDEGSNLAKDNFNFFNVVDLIFLQHLIQNCVCQFFR